MTDTAFSLTGTPEYDILIILLGILILAMAVNNVQKRVESLYVNHLALSHRVNQRVVLEDVVE